MNKMTLNIKNLFVGVAFATAMTGCVDMDVTPPASISPDTFWKTEKDAWYGLNACYAYMPGCDVFQDAYVDNAFNHHAHESKGQTLQTATMNPSVDYGYGYTDIRSFNVFLENVENCEMDPDLKERMKAEARFMRANGYLWLNLFFGKATIITEVLPYDSPNLPRDSEEEVRKFIMDELTEISQILPSSYSGGYLNETGRVTRWAALALKARAALYWGDYATAEAVSREIMRDGGFDLFKVSSLSAVQQKEADELEQYVDFAALGIDKDEFTKGIFSYEGIWATENASPANPEYILTRQYMAGNGDYGDFTRYIQMRPDQMNGGWASVEPIQSLVDAYWNADGKTKPATLTPKERADRFKVMLADRDEYTTVSEFVQDKIGDFKNYAYNQEFRNRDSRLYASILFPFKGWYETDMGPDFVYEWKHSNNDPKGGYMFRKMVPLGTNTLIWDYYPVAEGDYPVIRYAEILLIFAEAHLHTTGYDKEVRDALNKLRARCGMPDVPVSLSKDDAVEFVRNERRIELAGEGHRYFDIRRYGKDYAAKCMNMTMYSVDNNFNFAMKWDDRLMLMPIPQTAIDLNPLLKDDQNPGY